MLCVHVGEKVAMARKYHSPALTQDNLADALRPPMNRSTLARKESKGTFRPEEVTRIALLLGFEERWFWDPAETPPLGRSAQTGADKSGCLSPHAT